MTSPDSTRRPSTTDALIAERFGDGPTGLLQPITPAYTEFLRAQLDLLDPRETP